MEFRTRDEGRNHIREMLIDNEVVSWLTIIDYQMRVGAAVARMAGIAGVETHRQHRMKGYMRVLFDDTVRYMMDERYDVSVLFGIPNFYPKFGYAVCMPWPKVKVQTRDAELAKSAAESTACKVRPMEPDDISAIIDLYNRNNATRSLTLVRMPEYFKGFTKGLWWDARAEAIVVEDARGGFAGYAVWDKSDTVVNVIEVESVNASYYPVLLHEFAKQAINKRCGDISLFMPPDHPFGQFVLRYGCEWSIRYERHADGMMRILNQAALLEKLVPELQRRVTLVPGSLQGALAIQTNLGATTISIHDGMVKLAPGVQANSVVEMPQEKLAQLVVGYRSVSDVLSDGEVCSQGEVAPLLSALFPQGQPYMWAADHF